VQEAGLDLDDPIDVMAPLWEVALAFGAQSLPADRHALMEAPVQSLVRRGEACSAVQWRHWEQRRAQLALTLAQAHQRFDLLVTPQMPLTAFEAGREVPAGHPHDRWWTWSPYTYLFNLTQQPVATVPCGRGDDGLPVALQVVGRRFDDALVMRAAAAFEAAHPWSPPLARPAAPAAPAQVGGGLFR
jgi:aspartyl-tRNA(Asn)/glutamyl-tRNA(Gln) amidotransferase subunit A